MKFIDEVTVDGVVYPIHQEEFDDKYTFSTIIEDKVVPLEGELNKALWEDLQNIYGLDPLEELRIILTVEFTLNIEKLLGKNPSITL